MIDTTMVIIKVFFLLLVTNAIGITTVSAALTSLLRRISNHNDNIIKKRDNNDSDAICRIDKIVANDGSSIRLCHLVEVSVSISSSSSSILKNYHGLKNNDDDDKNNAVSPPTIITSIYIPENVPDDSLFVRYNKKDSSCCYRKEEDGKLYFNITETTIASKGKEKNVVTVLSQEEINRMMFELEQQEESEIDKQHLHHYVKRNLQGTLYGSGTNTMLIVMVNPNELTTTNDEARESLFGVTNSMSSQMKACSNGQLEVVPLEGENPISLETDQPTSTYSGYEEMYESLLPKLLAKYNQPTVNTGPGIIAHHIFFVLPSTLNNPAGQTAWAANPGQHLGVLDNYIPSVMNTLHELGHNYGLQHSWENGENYGDQSVVMGAQQFVTSICFNGYHMRKMDWYYERSKAFESDDIDTNGAIVKIAFFGDYDLMEEGEHIIWVSIGESGEDGEIFLNYNRARDANAQTIEHADKLLVNKKTFRNPGDENPYTELMEALDENSGPATITTNLQNTGKTLVVEVCSSTAKTATEPDYLTVAIGSVSGLCSDVTPAPTIKSITPAPTKTPDTPTSKPTPLPTRGTPDNSNTVLVHVDITYDNNPEQNSWKMYSSQTEQLIYQSPPNNKPNAMISTPLNVVPGNYRFEITDSAGNGMCCNNGRGRIEIYQPIINGNNSLNGGIRLYIGYSSGKFTNEYIQSMQTWDMTWYN